MGTSVERKNEVGTPSYVSHCFLHAVSAFTYKCRGAKNHGEKKMTVKRTVWGPPSASFYHNRSNSVQTGPKDYTILRLLYMIDFLRFIRIKLINYAAP